MNNQLTAIPFHGDTLFLIDHEGQPYTPVKPICENMGLDWKGQHAKLSAEKGKWGMEISPYLTPGGKQEMVCFPLRKLTAFLYSVNAAKVKPEIRKKVELYQAECDDVLWDYWTKGQATNPRMSDHLEGASLEPLQDKYTRLMEKHLALLEEKAYPIKKARKKHTPITTEDRIEIITLFGQGLSQAEIARQVERSSATVSGVVRNAVKGGSA